MVGDILLVVASTGLIACTVFLLLLVIACLRCRRTRRTAAVADCPSPFVSLLKPLHGWEPDLERNLESFFQQHYPSFELIFAARSSNDPALGLVRQLQERYPSIPATIVIAGEPDLPNAKVCALEKMMAAVNSDYVIISDSDVRVGPGYVEEIIGALLAPDVGLVTCLYRGVPTGGFWSKLEALGMSVEMTAGVLVADLLEGMRFALGPTMAIRRDLLVSIGGFRALAEYCADDFVLGQRVHAAGRRVVLSRYTVEHVVLNQRLTASLLHQVRWMKSTRFSRPLGHVGTGLTFAMPFGILGLVAACALGLPMLGVGFLAYAVLNRMAEALIAGWGVVEDPFCRRYFWLYPARDLLGFFLWCASFFGTTITWRGERYRLEPEGRMVRCATPVGLNESGVMSEPARVSET